MILSTLRASVYTALALSSVLWFANQASGQQGSKAKVPLRTSPAVVALGTTGPLPIQGSAPTSKVNQSGQIESTAAAVASFAPFLEYTPFGPQSTIRVPYWKKHLPDDAGTFTMHVQLSRPAGPSGASLGYSTMGTAVDGLHYQINAPNPLVFAPGETQAEIPVQLLASGEFFRERFLQVELTQPQGASLHPKEFVGQLWIRPSVDPPTLTFTNTAFVTTAGGQTAVDFQLSHPSQERTSLHYTVEPLSDLTDYTFADSGSIVLQPGQTSGQLTFEPGPTAAVGQRLLIRLRHERNQVRYTVPALDTNLTSNPDLYPQDIHIDENMWTFSVGGVQAFENSDLRNPPLIGPTMPGVPTDNITGGSFWAPGQENEELVDLLPQMDPNPVLDPFSGLPLRLFAISDAATGLAPYIRKSFNNSFCGGNTQLYSLPEYMRVSYYIQLPQGLDAPQGVPFFRVGIRVRSQDINHGVTFRINSPGVDANGNPVITIPTSMGPIGVWATEQITPSTCRFGIVEDEYGVRVWYAHRLDPSVPYVHPVVGDQRFETPGMDSGNPIEYPTWASTGDSSLAVMGLSSIDDLTGSGNLAYGFMWEISDEPNIFNDQLKPYFPKPGSWWEPVGNAVLDQSTALLFVVQ